MHITTNQILKVLLILSWIIFVGISIEAAAIICNAVFTLVLNPEAAKNLWQMVDLSALYDYDPGHFLALTSMITIAGVSKALLFYLIIRMLQHKKLDMERPFNAHLVRFIRNMSSLSLLIGLFSNYGVNYSRWLAKKGISIPDASSLQIDGGDTWLFMAVVLFVIAHIIKKGIEIQQENELTV